MLRYYMTSQTRQSLIEESNRQIAMRAIASAARGRRVSLAPTVSESAFARRVADLEATSQPSASERQPD